MRASLAFDSWKSYLAMIKELEKALLQDSPLFDCVNKDDPNEVKAAIERTHARIATAKRQVEVFRREMFRDLDLMTQTHEDVLASAYPVEELPKPNAGIPRP